MQSLLLDTLCKSLEEQEAKWRRQVGLAPSMMCCFVGLQEATQGKLEGVVGFGQSKHLLRRQRLMMASAPRAPSPAAQVAELFDALSKTLCLPRLHQPGRERAHDLLLLLRRTVLAVGTAKGLLPCEPGASASAASCGASAGTGVQAADPASGGSSGGRVGHMLQLVGLPLILEAVEQHLQALQVLSPGCAKQVGAPPAPSVGACCMLAYVVLAAHALRRRPARRAPLHSSSLHTPAHANRPTTPPAACRPQAQLFAAFLPAISEACAPLRSPDIAAVVEQAQRRLDAAGASMLELDQLAAAVRRPGEGEPPPSELLVKVGRLAGCGCLVVVVRRWSGGCRGCLLCDRSARLRAAGAAPHAHPAGPLPALPAGVRPHACACACSSDSSRHRILLQRCLCRGLRRRQLCRCWPRRCRRGRGAACARHARRRWRARARARPRACPSARRRPGERLPAQSSTTAALLLLLHPQLPWLCMARHPDGPTSPSPLLPTTATLATCRRWLAAAVATWCWT